MNRGGITTRKSIAEILRTSDADDPATDSRRMAKTLGPVSITALGIGAILGAGIFVLTGTAAARYAGPAIMLSFVFGGIVCGFVGLCYAELAAMLPVSGSTYTYAYVALGEVFAWIIGWDLVLEYAMGGATVAVGWSGYATSLLHSAGIDIPAALAAAPGVRVAGGGTGIVNLPAAFIVAALSALLVFGTSGSSRLNNIMVAVKLVVILGFIVLGVGHVNPAHWHPFVPPNDGRFGGFGASGILRGAAVVFYAFLGFDAISTAAQEARNPQRDMPVGIIGSIAICTILYIAVAAVLTGLLPYGQLNVADPIAKGMDAVGISWASIMVKCGALIGLTTVILVALYGQSRVLYSIASDGLLPDVFARLHPRLRTPWLSQLLIGAVVCAIAALTPITVLSELVSIGTLFAFVVVCGSVIYLRRTQAATQRPFRVPGVPWVPALGIVFSITMMAGLPLMTWLRLIIWMAIGLVVYVLYGRSHARAGGRS